MCSSSCHFTLYASAVWSPHLVEDINKIEMVQHHAARIVHNNFTRTASVTTMLTQLNWPTLDLSRNQVFFTKL